MWERYYIVLVLVKYDNPGILVFMHALQVERVPLVQSELIDCFTAVVLYFNVSGRCITAIRKDSERNRPCEQEGNISVSFSAQMLSAAEASHLFWRANRLWRFRDQCQAAVRSTQTSVTRSGRLTDRLCVESYNVTPLTSIICSEGDTPCFQRRNNLHIKHITWNSSNDRKLLT